MTYNSSDPIFYKDEEWDLYEETLPAGWYFWDETWADCYGPFETKEEAEILLNKYAHFLDTGEYEK